MTDAPRRVLVTGGAGYVGIHAVAELALTGYQVIVLDNLEHGEPSWVQDTLGCDLVVADIADGETVRAVCRHYDIEAIVHFAAYAYVGESMSAPLKYWRNNVAGTLTLLEVANELGIDKFVFSSSCATYGIPDRVPIDEDSPQRPINPYGATKLAVEQMLDHLQAASEFRSVALRYFNAAGADPEARFGETHDPETHLIPLLLAAAAGDTQSFTIYGNDYETPDGTCIRDYVHVNDLATAHRLALDHLWSGAESLRLNLSTSQGFSVAEVVEAAERVTGVELPVHVGPRRLGDPAVLVGAGELAQTTLGWRPRYTELDDVIAHAWKWYQKHHRPGPQ